MSFHKLEHSGLINSTLLLFKACLSSECFQIQNECCSNAAFGHFSSPELFHFLARATFGAYIPESSQAKADVRILCKDVTTQSSEYLI